MGKKQQTLVNCPVKVTYRTRVAFNEIHGIISNFGKDFILFLDHYKNEIPIKRSNIISIEHIKL